MDSLFFFKRSLMAIFLLGVVIGAHEYHHTTDTQDPASIKGKAEDKLSKSKVLLSKFLSPFNRRLARSIVNETTPSPSTCNTINYHPSSQSSRQSTCPFDWVVNFENHRIPERIVEQVCLSCGSSCGQSHQCTQLKVQYQVYFRDTEEYSQQVVRAGCACMPHDIGFTADMVSPAYARSLRGGAVVN